MRDNVASWGRLDAPAVNIIKVSASFAWTFPPFHSSFHFPRVQMSTPIPLAPSSTQHNQATAAPVLTQTTLDASMKRKSTVVAPNPKKRKLALADGSELFWHIIYIVTNSLLTRFLLAPVLQASWTSPALSLQLQRLSPPCASVSLRYRRLNLYAASN